MKKGAFVLFALVIVLSTQYACASFDYKNNTLEKQYSAGDIVSGLINISFQNQSAYSNFTTNFGGNITLRDLIELAGYEIGTDFTCSTANCSEGFVSDESVTNLHLNGEAFVGFRVNGKSISQIGVQSDVNTLRLGIQSDIGQSCYNQLLVDIGAKGERYLFNNRTTDSVCDAPKDYGCFDSGLSEDVYQNSVIGTVKYCENISVRAAAAYKLGAKISKRTCPVGTPCGNNATLYMALYGTNGNMLRGCALGNLSQNTEELECSVYYGAPVQKEFLVCIYASETDSKYQIRMENRGRVCGGDSSNFASLNVLDPEVFIRPLQSDTINMDINNNAFTNFYSGWVGGYMLNYLREQYPTDLNENINCESGCVIPIRLLGPDQNVMFNNIYLFYKNYATGVTTNSIYSLIKSSGKINSGYLQLDLAKAGFSIPYGTKPNKFTLYLEGNKVFESTINVSAGFYFDINPKNVLVGQSTRFSAGNTSISVSSSKWDFGDGQIINSNSGNVTYSFNSIGIKSVKVTLVGVDGVSTTKTFEIDASGSNESAWLILNKYEGRVANLTRQIESYPAWISAELKKKVNVVELNASLTQLRKQLNEATDDEGSISVLTRLLELNVPIKLVNSKSGSIPISIGFGSLNANYIQDLSGANNNSIEEVKEGVIRWINTNYNGMVDFESIDSYGDNSILTNILSKYRVTLTPQADEGDYTKYFIINYPMDAIKFMSDYGERAKGSATYMTFTGGQRVFEFVIPGFAQVQELGMYVAPEVDNLNIVGEIGIAEKPHFNWSRFITFTGLILIVTLVIYILLQEWYKYRYESYLFRQRNDLYNIITFIFNSRNSKLNDNEIRRRLSGAGWNGEQINYALKKIDGKRTGMFEIPIMRPFEKRKINREIAKRQPNANFNKGLRL